MQIRLNIAMLLLVGLLGSPAAMAQVVVIAHKDVPADSVSKEELFDYYSGEKRSWDGELQVIAFDLKSRGPVRDAFYDYMGKTSSRMRSIWLKRKLAGEGNPPQSFETEEELVGQVAATVGAIGFVSAAKVSDGVKTLATIVITDN